LQRHTAFSVGSFYLQLRFFSIRNFLTSRLRIFRQRFFFIFCLYSLQRICSFFPVPRKIKSFFYFSLYFKEVSFFFTVLSIMSKNSFFQLRIKN
jgi:hypothetical protein